MSTPGCFRRLKWEESFQRAWRPLQHPWVLNEHSGIGVFLSGSSELLSASEINKNLCSKIKCSQTTEQISNLLGSSWEKKAWTISVESSRVHQQSVKIGYQKESAFEQRNSFPSCTKLQNRLDLSFPLSFSSSCRCWPQSLGEQKQT